ACSPLSPAGARVRRARAGNRDGHRARPAHRRTSPHPRPPRRRLVSRRRSPGSQSSRCKSGCASSANAGQPPVDSIVDAPYAGCMNLQVPPELEAKLTRLAAETGRTADQVAIDLLASSVDHDEWFRGEVEKGRASAREGRLLEHDDVVARMD